MANVTNVANLAKHYRDVKISEEVAKIIDEQIVGRQGYRSRNQYVNELILRDLKKRKLLKGIVQGDQSG